ncbi:uncharacterized protein LOC136077155 [Hydra vulgaris]|uniref:Uncharacterized protein LOC136077155 n=1 Tax=Hydra vulgaris TaxID=6087 RepID=A0ABM4BG25_HYDVU
MDKVLQSAQFQIKLSKLLVQDWFEIGIYLKVKPYVLEAIRNDSINLLKQEDKAYEMIKKWFDFDENPTFEKLKRAISSIPKFKLLKEVEDFAKKFDYDDDGDDGDDGSETSLNHIGLLKTYETSNLPESAYRISVNKEISNSPVSSTKFSAKKETSNSPVNSTKFSAKKDYYFKEMDNKKYRDILLKIADNLLDKDVEAIKFYYSQQIGYGHLERIKTPIELIQTLERCMLLGIDNYDDFVEVLNKIKRNDLANYFSSEFYNSIIFFISVLFFKSILY